jgi:capsid protein
MKFSLRNLLRKDTGTKSLKSKHSGVFGGFLRKASAYESAGYGRRLQRWTTSAGSMNTVLLNDLETLQTRSRDAVRNNPYAANILDVIVANAIGTGIKPQSLAEDKAAIDALWLNWTDHADHDGMQDFYGLQGLILRCVVESGECFVRFKVNRNQAGRSGSDEAVPLQLQVLESEFLENITTLLPNGNRIVGGIELNPQGAGLLTICTKITQVTMLLKVMKLFASHPTMQFLEPGEDVRFSQPGDVGGTYEAFMRQQLRSIAVGMGITYEQLTGDLSGVNYSSIRAGLVEFRRRIAMIQHHLMVFQLCRPVWNRWFELAILSNQLPLNADTKVKWIPQGFDWVDPLKDIIAYATAWKPRNCWCSWQTSRSDVYYSAYSS